MFIAPKISPQRAENILSTGKPTFPSIGNLLLRKKEAAPEKTELFYLPFYLFDVFVGNEKKRKNTQNTPQKVTLSVDGILGHAVLYASDVTDVENKPRSPAPFCDFEITSSVAAKRVMDTYKGILIEHGLRTRSHSSVDEISAGKQVFYPFWLAYYKKKKGYDFKALDGVSGEIQGVKMRRLFIRALKKLGHQS